MATALIGPLAWESPYAAGAAQDQEIAKRPPPPKKRKGPFFSLAAAFYRKYNLLNLEFALGSAWVDMKFFPYD